MTLDEAFALLDAVYPVAEDWMHYIGRASRDPEIIGPPHQKMAYGAKVYRYHQGSSYWHTGFGDTAEAAVRDLLTTPPPW
jgi:hypothetical protein